MNKNENRLMLVNVLLALYDKQWKRIKKIILKHDFSGSSFPMLTEFYSRLAAAHIGWAFQWKDKREADRFVDQCMVAVGETIKAQLDEIRNELGAKINRAMTERS